MKKIFAFFLVVIYFIVSTGFVVNVHYCMGKLSSIKIEQPAKKCCCKKPHKNCCKTEQQLVKLSTNSKYVDTWISEKINFEVADLPQTFLFSSSINSFPKSTNLFYNYPPPDKENKFALYHYCILLI